MKTGMFTPRGIALLKLLKLIPDLQGRELANYLMSHPVIHPRCGRIISSVDIRNYRGYRYFRFVHRQDPITANAVRQCVERIPPSLVLPSELASRKDLYAKQIGLPNLKGCLMIVLSENPGPWKISDLTTAALKINPEASTALRPRNVVRHLLTTVPGLRKLGYDSYFYGPGVPTVNPPAITRILEPTPVENAIRIVGPAPKSCGVSPETAFWIENWLDGPGTRKVAKWTGVSHMTFDRELVEIAKRAKPPEMLSQELQPKWTGDFGIDVTYVPVLLLDKQTGEEHYGKKGIISIVDGSGDWPSHGIVSNELNQTEVGDFISGTISSVGYEFKTGFCDSTYAFEEVFASFSPKTRLFPDLTHVYRSVVRKVSLKAPNSRSQPAQDKGPRSKFLDMVHGLVWPTSKRSFDKDLSRLVTRVVKERQFHKDWTIKGLKLLLHQLGAVELSMKFRERSPLLRAYLFGTNGVENAYSLIKPKIKRMKGFPSEQNLPYYLNLMYGYRRLRPYLASEIPEHQGKAPLELAGAKDLDLKNTHWLDSLLRP